MTDAKHVPGKLPIKGWAGAKITQPLNFVDSNGDPVARPSGSWAAYVHQNTKTTVAAATFTVTTGTNSVTVELAAADTTALVGAGTRYTGYWVLWNTTNSRPYLAGPILLTRTPDDLA